MTIVCLGYRKGFAEAARLRGQPLHFIVEKVKPAIDRFDHTKVSDLADTEEVLRAVSEAVPAGVTAVVTGHEQAVFTAALLRSVIGLPGDTDVLRCLRFRDKRIQKRSVSSSIPRARCEYLPLATPRYPELADRLGASIVVKPADGHGSQATHLVTGQADLDDYFARHPLVSDVQTVAESFVEGDEIHVDGVWIRGEPLWTAVSKYTGPLMGWTDGTAVGDAPLGPAERELSERASEFAAEVLSDLAAPDTVFHLEAFVQPGGELVLGEVAARTAGALTPEVLRLTHGIDLYGAALDLALGRTPELPAPSSGPGRLFGWIYLTREPDQDLSEESFRSRFDLVELSYPDSAAGRTGSYGRWGHAIIGAPTHEQLMRELRAIAEFSRGA
ncbi:hypothetical protein AB0M50_29425 [Nonomuraea fuscirosea]|uniref:ATP-grasp domain-containing protein n=1 Tax=Nonomuraea fuscirosea TaxID=1291556 RepID=UPI003420DF56